jgi:hypothetical protein
VAEESSRSRHSADGLRGDADESDALSHQLTIQASAVTSAAVASLRLWAQRSLESAGPRHCVILGPKGSGRTHLLDALAGVLPIDSVIRFSLSKDWREPLRAIGETHGRILLVDDLDLYDDKFRKAFFVAVGAGEHQLVAVLPSPFDVRVEKTWRAHLSEPSLIQLGPLSDRREDLTAFLPYWALQHDVALPADARFDETVRLLLKMELRHGLSDAVRLVTEIVSRREPFWDPPDASVWLGAYRRAIVGGRSTQPVVLVEGRTELLYFDWVIRLCAGSTSVDVEVEPCHSAKKIPPRAIACRNEGRMAVALFDNDVVGREQHKQLRSYDIRSVVIPDRFNQLGSAGRDHVLVVVEIEDLLPVSAIEQFLEDRKREPELVIVAPRERRKRVVVHSDDKLALAEWVCENLGIESAGEIVSLFNELRIALGLAPLSLPKAA